MAKSRKMTSPPYRKYSIGRWYTAEVQKDKPKLSSTRQHKNIYWAAQWFPMIFYTQLLIVFLCVKKRTHELNDSIVHTATVFVRVLRMILTIFNKSLAIRNEFQRVIQLPHEQ